MARPVRGPAPRRVPLRPPGLGIEAAFYELLRTTTNYD